MAAPVFDEFAVKVLAGTVLLDGTLDVPRNARGGRPDLAGPALRRVQVPTLLIVGGNDQPVTALNQRAMTRMSTVTSLEIVPGATHLFEEPGALAEVARLAADWFAKHLA